MSHILTIAGREHTLLPPSGANAAPATQPSLSEIAWSLAHINRYTGHSLRAYSVAEHSLLVADIARARGASTLGVLCALMHDAHECIVGDVTSPVKALLGNLWASFEDYHQSALLQHFALHIASHAFADDIKRADLIALATERRDLLNYKPGLHTPWPSIDLPGAEILPWDEVYLMSGSRIQEQPDQWAAEFELRAKELMAGCGIGA